MSVKVGLILKLIREKSTGSVLRVEIELDGLVGFTFVTIV
jgi:hypothetical protein